MRTLIVAALLIAAHAHADVVEPNRQLPPAPICAPGSSLTSFSHSSPGICISQDCTTDADCGEGHCEPTDLCVRNETDGHSGQSYQAAWSCGECPEGLSCQRTNRCVSPPPAPPATGGCASCAIAPRATHAPFAAAIAILALSRRRRDRGATSSR